MSEELVSKDYVFTKKDGKLEYVGDFEGLYSSEENPWGQDGSDERLKEYYEYSRKSMLKALTLSDREINRFLEIGCGLGYVVDYFAQNTPYKCYGMDISPTAIKKAQKLFPNATFYCDDIMSSSLQLKQTFDVILINQVLWYLLDDLEQVFKNVANHLSSGGYLLIVNAYLGDQQFAKERMDGFGGLLQYLENNQTSIFDIVYASLYNKDIFHKDGLVMLKKRD